MRAVSVVQRLKNLLRFKSVRYGIVGGGGGCASFLLYASLVHGGVWYLYASPISSWVTYVLSFTLQKTWTFESKEVYTAAWQLPAHLCLKLVWNALFVTPLLLYVLVEYWEWNTLLAQPVAGVSIGFFQNFLICKHVIFGSWLAHRLGARNVSGPAP